MNVKRKKATAAAAAKEKRPQTKRGVSKNGANAGAKIRSRSGCHTCKAKHVSSHRHHPLISSGISAIIIIIIITSHIH